MTSCRLSAALIGKFMGARVLVVDINDKRLDLAKQIGVARTINPTRQSVVDEVLGFTNGAGALVTIDATGNPQVRGMMFDCAKTWGRAAFVGEGHTGTFDISQQIIHEQLTILGSWVYSAPMMMELAKLCSRHGISLGELLVTDRFQIKDAPQAFQRFSAGDTAGKGVFVWN
jgi:threonine dehydrogenase-like Zn-dependent dehydrogenase